LLVVAGGVVSGCVLGVIGAVALTQSPQDAAAARAVPVLPTVTAQIVPQRLVDSADVRCEFTAVELSARAPVSSGRYRSRVVTAVGVSPGHELKSGTFVVAVSGRPVIAFVTPVPFYRDLKVGDVGVDVKGLEEGLRAAGRIKHADRTLDEVTAAALAAIYRKTGITVNSAFQVDSAWAVPKHARVRSLSVRVGDLVSGKDDLVSARSSSGSWECHVPGGIDVSARKTLDATANSKQVTVSVDKVTVDEESGDSIVLITPSVDVDPDAELRVLVVSADTNEPVLTVPAGALFAMADGSPSLRVVRDSGSSEVPVRTGVAAGGWVEVSGDGLTAGLNVLIRGSE